MSRASTEQIIAHASLLRAIDRLLAEADQVRDKREALAKLLSQLNKPGDGQESGS
jgi:hypothetical protein